MAIPLIKGQRIPLNKVIASIQRPFFIDTRLKSSLTLDYACFMLNDDGKIIDDNHIIFYNQPNYGGCSLDVLKVKNSSKVHFDLSVMACNIRKIVITIAIDGSGQMSQIEDGRLRVYYNNTWTAEWQIRGNDFSLERAVMLCELYRKGDEWWFAVVGQGFNGGLPELVKFFGGNIA